MAVGLEFDVRLWNPYAVENLEQTHPAVHAALKAWFNALQGFDESSLEKLVSARTPEEVAKWRAKGEAALASAPSVTATLDTLIRELDLALSGTPGQEQEQLEGLKQSALANRAALVERAPALVAKALAAPAPRGDVKDAAVRAVNEAVSRLEAILAQSKDPGRPYRDLQPLVGQLRALWSDLDQALAPLSRNEQRAVRGEQNARMVLASSALCRNLFLAKMRERKSGRWPLPEVRAPGHSAAEQFAAALARGEYSKAHGLLAPWLRHEWPAERLQEELERSAAAIAAGFDLAEPPPPGDYSASVNPMTYANVREADTSGAVPSEITADTFRGWFPIRIQTDDEDSYLTDLDCLFSFFAIAVEANGREQSGYLRLEE
jgi:hypothetical protein